MTEFSDNKSLKPNQQLEVLQELARRLNTSLTQQSMAEDSSEIPEDFFGDVCFLSKKLTYYLSEFKISSQSDVTPIQNDLIAMQKELQLAEKKINEYRSSLADSYVEIRNCQNEIKQLKNEKSELTLEVSQLNTQLKAVNLDLSAAQANIKAKNDLLADLENAMGDLRDKNRDQSEQIFDQNEEKESLQTDFTNVVKELADLRAKYAKLNTDFECVNATYTTLKANNDNFELRENELLSCIDNLQKEKNNIQNRLNGLLIDVNKYVPHYTNEPQSSSVLNPREFNVFLPFCYPERLPARKMLVEVQSTYKSAIGPQKPLFNKCFPSSMFDIRPEKEQPHIFTQKHSIKMEPVFCLDFAINDIAPYVPGLDIYNVHAVHIKNRLPLDCVQTGQFEHSPLPECKPAIQIKLDPPIPLKYQKVVMMYIRLFSMEAFLNYIAGRFVPLESAIPIKAYDYKIPNDDRYDDFEVVNPIPDSYRLTSRKFITTRQESMPYERPTLRLTVTQGAKLRNVLEMFGNTISDFVQKYDRKTTSEQSEEPDSQVPQIGASENK